MKIVIYFQKKKYAYLDMLHFTSSKIASIYIRSRSTSSISLLLAQLAKSNSGSNREAVTICLVLRRNWLDSIFGLVELFVKLFVSLLVDIWTLLVLILVLVPKLLVDIVISLLPILLLVLLILVEIKGGIAEQFEIVTLGGFGLSVKKRKGKINNN